jgi:hypothetical protein
VTLANTKQPYPIMTKANKHQSILFTQNCLINLPSIGKMSKKVTLQATMDMDMTMAMNDT